MELTNEFMVERPIEETWKIINDLEFIAPCMPGAQLTEIEGEEYRGLVKIKVGPVTAKYKGKASFISQDPEAKVSKLSAEGRDPRNGNANATITATMEEVDEGTLVTIHTDLALVGKVASFGRGAIEDVSKKLLGMFSDNLRDKLAETDGAPSPAPGEVVGQAATEAANESGSDGTGLVGTGSDGPASDTATGSVKTETTQETPKVRKIHSEEPDAVDIFAVTGDSLMKRLGPVLGAVLALVVLRMLLRGRASD